MREDFRCIACGHSFGYDFSEGDEKTVSCPKCNQLWKVEKGSGGMFRIFMWV